MRIVQRTIVLAGVAVLVLASSAQSSADQLNFEKIKAQHYTYPLHGAFGLTKIDIAEFTKANPKSIPKPEAEAGDEETFDEFRPNVPPRPGPSADEFRNKLPPRPKGPMPPGLSAGEIPDSTLNKAGNILRPFQGFSVDGANLEPLDLQIAASKTHVVITSSHRVTFWTRDGKLLSAVNTLDFFNLVKDDLNKVLKDPVDGTKTVGMTYPINEFYDTRLIFDTYRNRFWIVCLTRNMGPKPKNPTPAQVDKWAHRVGVSSIAVSKTENPQDGWYTYWMKPARDYQAVGVSKKLLVIGHKEVGYPQFGFITVLNPDPLIIGTAGQEVTALGSLKKPDGSPAIGETEYMQPALHYGPSPGDTQFFVSNPGGVGSTNIVWGLNPNDLNIYRAEVTVASYAHAKAAEQASHADIPHPHLVSAAKVGDTILKAVCRNNKLYWVWDDSKPNDTRQLQFIRLNRVDVSQFPSYIRTGSGSGMIDRRFGKRNELEDPPNKVFSYYMPALTVNKDGSMVVSYCRSGATIWPEARYSVYFEKDADIRPSQLMHKGEYPIGTDDPDYNSQPEKRTPAGRFDYNGNAVDPIDDRSVWVINVFAVMKNKGQGKYSLLVRRIPFGPP